MEDIWNEIGLTAFVGVVAILLSSMGSCDMKTLVWLAHAPVEKTKHMVWYVWIVWNIMTAGVILAVILDIDNFSGAVTRIPHRQIAIVASVCVCQFLVVLWSHAACAVDVDPNTGERYTSKQLFNLLLTDATEQTAKAYFYGNTYLNWLIAHAALLFVFTGVTLCLITVDYNGSDSNIVVTAFWTINTAIALIGLMYTLYMFIRWGEDRAE